ncbi:MAG: hypothetical protein EXX96DRAFT_574571 [Benjaminiella poitrasii]|nr:MAG: hypothetical protein EXX96DRAFT_574571 [Benjaminiella poitrasii]
MGKEVTKRSAKKTNLYTEFMSTEIPKVKKENPGFTHKEAFKKAASNWATSPSNPKNKK